LDESLEKNGSARQTDKLDPTTYESHELLPIGEEALNEDDDTPQEPESVI